MWFLFELTTAYEMRISYWSSDVCSSDLRGRVQTGGLRADRRRDGRDAGNVFRRRLRPGGILRRRGRTQGCADRRQGGGGRRDPGPCFVRRAFERLFAGPAAGGGQGVEARSPEIGRASCRERVWQYV